MKKRLFAILLAALLLFAACGTDIDIPARGYWDGDTFVSAYFGLRFDLPQGWAIASEEEIAEAMWLDADVRVEPGTHIPQEVFDALGELQLPDMWAQESPLGMFRNNAVMTAIGRLPDDAPLSEIDMFLEIVEQVQDNEWLDFVIGEGTIRIGAHDWYFADQHFITGWNISDPSAAEMHNQRAFARFDNGFIKMLSIVYYDADMLQDIMANFRPY